MDESFNTWRKSPRNNDDAPLVISSDDEVIAPFNKKRINRINFLDSSEDRHDFSKIDTPNMTLSKVCSTPLLRNFQKSNILHEKYDSGSILISDSDDEYCKKSPKEHIYICDSSSDKENMSTDSFTKQKYVRNEKPNYRNTLFEKKKKNKKQYLCNSDSKRNRSNDSLSDTESYKFVSEKSNSFLKKTKKSKKRKDVSHDDTKECVKGLKLNTSSDSVTDLSLDENNDYMDEKNKSSVRTKSIHREEGATSNYKTSVDSGSDSSEFNAKLAMSPRKFDCYNDRNASTSFIQDNKFAMSLVKDDLGDSNIDAMIAQKTALLLCKLKHLQDQLTNTELLMISMNVDTLPDQGEEIRKSILALKEEINDVNAELDATEAVRSTNDNFHISNRFSSFELNECKTGFQAKADFLPETKEEKRNFPTLEDDEDCYEVPVENKNFKYSPPNMMEDDFDKWGTDPEEFMTSDKFKQLGKKAQDTHDKQLSLTVDKLQALHGSLTTRPKENEIAEDPEGLKIKLMPHQQHALAWCLWRETQVPRGGVLADDMGLGKTLTMISLVLKTLDDVHDEPNLDSSSSSSSWVSHKKPLRFRGGTLIVCPASLLAQWETEIKTRCKRGIISVQVYHGNSRDIVPKRLGRFNVVITTYNILSREHKKMSTLFKIDWKRVILDEAHVVRNYKSQASQAVCNLQAKSRWALTGTPIHNKELDLFAIFKFLQCSPFNDIRMWKRWVNNNSASGHQRLATIMKTLMLRRTKQELQAKGALRGLPNKFIEEIEVVLNSQEQLVYQKVLVYSRTLFAQFLSQRAEKHHMVNLFAGKYDKPTYNTNPNQKTEFTKAQKQLLAMHAGKVEAHEILVLLLRLRQICCHPALIHAMLDREDMQQNGLVEEETVDNNLLSQMNNISLCEVDAENSEEDEDVIDERVKTNVLTARNPVFENTRISAKMKCILNKVSEILETDDKLIIVSQWTNLLEVIAFHLRSIKGATFSKFTGQVPIKDRQAVQDSFNNVNTKPRILLLSLTAGGVGLNLVGGNHLLLIDNHWNPQLESQAQDRIYRFGQTKDVYIYKFICKDTIEERIKKLQEHKLSIAQNVLSGDKHVPIAKLTLQDLKTLFEI